MRSGVCVLLLSLLLAGPFPSLAVSQARPAVSNTGLSLFLPRLPAIPVPGATDRRGGKLKAWAGIGCRRLDMSFTSEAEQADMYALGETRPLEFKMKTALLFGAVGLEKEVTTGLTLFLSVEGNDPRGFTVRPKPKQESMTVPVGLRAGSGPTPSDSALEWRTVDWGAIYRLNNLGSVVSGVRFETLAVRSDAPPPSLGEFTSTPHVSDLQATSWIPYMGILLKGRTWKVRALGSIVSSTTVHVGLGAPANIARIGVGQLGHIPFKVGRPGYFIEVEGVYVMSVRNGITVSLWAGGNCMRFGGAGRNSGDDKAGSDENRQRAVDADQSVYSRSTVGYGIRILRSF